MRENLPLKDNSFPKPKSIPSILSISKENLVIPINKSPLGKQSSSFNFLLHSELQTIKTDPSDDFSPLKGLNFKIF